MNRLAALLLPLVAVLSACSGFSEAARDRLGWEFAGREVKIRLNCSRPLAQAPTPASVGQPARLAVRGATNGGDPVVGELFKWRAPGEPAIPMVVEGYPDAVLLHDVKTILARNSFEVSDDAGSRARLDTAVAVLRTWSQPAGWTELKGTIGARAGILVRLNLDGRLSWIRSLEGQHETRVAYFLTSDVEKTLNEAYCRCLEEFERLVGTPEFRRAVRGDTD